ncbi:MAG: DUF5047 domain-containing protein [Microbacteriaceae bacterium]
MSEEFLQTLPTGFRGINEAIASVNGDDYPLELTSGQVTMTGQEVNRTFTGKVSSEKYSVNELYDLLSIEGAIISIQTGMSWGGANQEIVPVFKGRIQTASKTETEGVVNLRASDYGADLNAQELITPIVHSASVTRRQAIIQLVQYGVPGVSFRDTSTDTGTLGSEQTWTGRLRQAIDTIAADAGVECFFAPDGAFVIRDAITEPGEPVYLMRTGNEGTITGLDRNRPLDRLFNCVIVEAATTDGSQPWSQVVVEITDTNNPRHKSKIGIRPIRIKSPTASETEAQRIGTQKLAQVQGKTETVVLSGITNPALERGDTIQIIAEGWKEQPAVVLNHIVDGLSMNLASFAMNLSTRNMGEF